MYLSVCLPFDEQEVDRKAHKQFKGLFDKKPGEIADAGAEDRGEEQSTSENQKNGSDQEDSDGVETEGFAEDAANAPREGWFSKLWPTGRRLFSALGLQRCTILWQNFKAGYALGNQCYLTAGWRGDLTEDHFWKE